MHVASTHTTSQPAEPVATALLVAESIAEEPAHPKPRASVVEPAAAAVAQPIPVTQSIPVAKAIPQPVLIAKPVPVAKAIAQLAEPVVAAPAAAPVAQVAVAQVAGSQSYVAQVAGAQSTIAQPVVEHNSIAQVTLTREAAHGDGQPVVPLTLLTSWLWHIRNLLAASTTSMIVHVCILVVLGSVMLNVPKKPKTDPPLEFSIAIAVPKKVEPPKVEAVVIKPIAQVKSTVASKGSGAGSQGEKGGVGGGKLGGLKLSPIKIDAADKMATGGTGFGTDKAYGDSMLGEVGELKDASATFFGVKATGRNFVFVVDTSGSMTRNDRYLRCRQELLRSIGALKVGQKYFVVFFNHTTFAMPEHKLVEARPAQITKTQDWCKLALPAGGTEPWDGVAMALRMKPDAIYLLTDGDFDPAVVDRINVAQPQTKKIPIHTICFESISGAVLLEAIAKITNGTYLYVP